jgi:hypothetical protein
MATRDRQNTVVLFSDVPGDERKVRAILADWGLPQAEINLLLREDEARTGRTNGRARSTRQTLPHRPRPPVGPA